MQKMLARTAILLYLFAPALLAGPIDLLQFTQNLPTKVPDQDRSVILGIFDSCGNANSIDDGCIMAGLQRIQADNTNLTAKAIITSYQATQAMGNANNPECQVESHLQANRLVGHCLLLMDYQALKNLETTAAVSQYENCILAGMQGLTYQGNIVAQYVLGQLYSSRGIEQAADTWKKAIMMRSDTDEYAKLIKCYQ